MKIDLARMARQKGIRRKSVSLRPIIPTRILENELFAIYGMSLDIWAKLVQDIVAIYDPVPVITTDAATQLQVQYLVDQVSSNVDETLVYQTDRLGRWVTRVGAWHGNKTISGVKSALGVDIEPFIRLPDLRETLETSIRGNVALIRSVNSDNRTRIEQVIADAFVNRRTKKEVSAALAKALGITKRRARMIANDQLYKLGVGLTAYRNEQLGIKSYTWETQRDDRVRHSHKVRQGKLFKWSEPPFDGHPGYPVGCRCLSVPQVDI